MSVPIPSYIVRPQVTTVPSDFSAANESLQEAISITSELRLSPKSLTHWSYCPIVGAPPQVTTEPSHFNAAKWLLVP